MTDTSEPAEPKKGVSKGVMGAIVVPLLAHYHAMIVLAVTQHYPIVDSFAAELLVAGVESFVGLNAVYWTPSSIVNEIVNLILWVKRACKRIRDARNSNT